MSTKAKPARPLPGSQFWLHHIRSHRKSRLSQARYCREHKLKLSTFRYWEKKLNPGELPLTATGKDESRSQNGFIDVTHILKSKDPAQANPFLEIMIGQDFRIKIPPKWDVDDLRKIIALVKEIVC